MKKIILTLGFITALMATFAQTDEQQFRQMLNEINADSIRATVQDLQNFPNRFAQTSNLEVAEYIVGRLSQYGMDDVRIDSFAVNLYSWFLQDNINHNMYNVIGTMRGSEQPDSIVIIGAHHDCITTNPPDYNIFYETTAGADDNASGCAVMLEIARIFHLHHFTPRYTIHFMTYDAEEFGLWGSNYDAEQRHNNGEKIALMLNNDMVAYDPDNSGELKLPWYENAIEEVHLAATMCDSFTTLTPIIPSVTDNTESYASDSYSYSLQGFPAVFAIENNFTPTYHTPGDTVGMYNFNYAAQVAKMNMAMLVHYSYHSVLGWTGTGICSTNPTRKLNLYPNPATEFIYFQCNDGEHVRMVQVFDLCGHLLLEQVSNHAISLSSLQPGVYFAKILFDDNAVHTQKIVKK